MKVKKLKLTDAFGDTLEITRHGDGSLSFVSQSRGDRVEIATKPEDNLALAYFFMGGVVEAEL
jgi:hypothetical protein